MFRKKQPKAKTILYQENMNKEKLKETFVVFDLFFHRMIRICLLSVYPHSKNLFPRVGGFPHDESQVCADIYWDIPVRISMASSEKSVADRIYFDLFWDDNPQQRLLHGVSLNGNFGFVVKFVFIKRIGWNTAFITA